MSVANGSRATQLRRLVPGIAVLRGYKREWFRHDLVAGLVLTTLLVPQGMAYAGLAGLPPETGMYTTAAALLAYALFGPSRILVVGPDSTLAPIVFATLIAVAGTGADPARAMALASALAILMGLICIAAGFAKRPRCPAWRAPWWDRSWQLGRSTFTAEASPLSEQPRTDSRPWPFPT